MEQRISYQQSVFYLICLSTVFIIGFWEPHQVLAARFAVIGDFGTKEEPLPENGNGSKGDEVADLVNRLDPDFIVSVGDNNQDGLVDSEATFELAVGRLYGPEAQGGTGQSREAESFNSMASSDCPRPGAEWVQIDDPDASGGVAMQVDARGRCTTAGQGAILSFDINFAEAGDYFVCVRGKGLSSSSDSVFFGLDNVFSDNDISRFRPYGTYVHSNDGRAAVLNVPTPGPHTFMLAHRERQFTVDKVFLTKDAACPPRDNGSSSRQDYVSTGRFFPVVGNHDIDAAQPSFTAFQITHYLDYFDNGPGNLPGDNPEYYDFTSNDGSVHFFMLNSMRGMQRNINGVMRERIVCQGNNDTARDNTSTYIPESPSTQRCDPSTWRPNRSDALNFDPNIACEDQSLNGLAEQACWLQRELAASNAPWKIVVFHHPPFNSGTRHEGNTQALQWPFEAWGADVVMSGHDHHYEMILRDDNRDGRQMPYFIVATGGWDVRGGLLPGCPNSTDASPVDPSDSDCAEGSAKRFNREDANHKDFGTLLVDATETCLDFAYHSIASSRPQPIHRFMSCKDERPSNGLIIAGFQSENSRTGQNPGEFVELFNPTGERISLATLELISRVDNDGDGEIEIDWRLSDEQPDLSGEFIEPYSFYLIAESGVVAPSGRHDLEVNMDLATGEGGVGEHAIALELRLDGIHQDYVLYGSDGAPPVANGEVPDGDLPFDGNFPRAEVLRNTLGTNTFQEGLIRRPSTAMALCTGPAVEGGYMDENPSGLWMSLHDRTDGNYEARNSLSPAISCDDDQGRQPGDVIIAGFQSENSRTGQSPGEFVELFNATGERISLATLELISRVDRDNDGEIEIDWRLSDERPDLSGAFIEPYSFYLIAESGVVAPSGRHDLEVNMDLATGEGGVGEHAIALELRLDSAHQDYVLYGSDNAPPVINGAVPDGDLPFDGNFPRAEVLRNTLGTNTFQEGLVRRPSTAAALCVGHAINGRYMEDNPSGLWMSLHDRTDGDYEARNSLSPAISCDDDQGRQPGDVIIAGFQSENSRTGQNPGEFVELFNTTSERISLATLELISRVDRDDDGEIEIDWRLSDERPDLSGAFIEPYSFYLIAESGVVAPSGLHDLEVSMDLATGEGGVGEHAIALELRLDGVHQDYVLYGSDDAPPVANGAVPDGDLPFNGNFPRVEVIRNTLGTDTFQEGLVRRPSTASALHAGHQVEGEYMDENPSGLWMSLHDRTDGNYEARNSLTLPIPPPGTN